MKSKYLSKAQLSSNNNKINFLINRVFDFYTKINNNFIGQGFLFSHCCIKNYLLPKHLQSYNYIKTDHHNKLLKYVSIFNIISYSYI